VVFGIVAHAQDLSPAERAMFAKFKPLRGTDETTGDHSTNDASAACDALKGEDSEWVSMGGPFQNNCP
jgi:hypothetical protein